MDKKNLKGLLKEYKFIKLTIENLNIDLDESNLKAVDYSYSNIQDDTFSGLDNSIYRRDKIRNKIRYLELQVKRVDNLLTVLTDREKLVIEYRYFKGLDYDTIARNIDKVYTTVKYIENKALDKMLEIING